LDKNKKYWPIFPLHIVNHTLSNKPHVEKEVEALRKICLCIGSIKGHDPRTVVYEHINVVKFSWQVVHEANFVEDLFRGAIFFEEVLDRIPSELAKEKLQKEEDEERVMIKEKFKELH
jgi:hypothetical protein